jgi:hypothetical protein
VVIGKVMQAKFIHLFIYFHFVSFETMNEQMGMMRWTIGAFKKDSNWAF